MTPFLDWKGVFAAGETRLAVRTKGGIFMEWFVNGEGGLTTAGYAVSIGLLAAFLLVGLALSGGGARKGMSARHLAFCAMALALAFVTSYIKPIPQMPYGGSVTLLSMLFIVLVGNWYGTRTGILVGLAYGILQFLQEPYFLTLFQVCCDYVFAFGALGISGLFRNRKNGLLWGYIAAVFARGFFHSLGGYLYWMDYMPENFPQSLKAVYPIVYNYSYLLVEGILTVIVIRVPAVASALERVKKQAVQ